MCLVTEITHTFIDISFHITKRKAFEKQSEMFFFTIARIVFEQKDWETKKEIDVADKVDWLEAEAMQKIRDRTRNTPLLMFLLVTENVP